MQTTRAETICCLRETNAKSSTVPIHTVWPEHRRTDGACKGDLIVDVQGFVVKRSGNPQVYTDTPWPLRPTAERLIQTIIYIVKRIVKLEYEQIYLTSEKGVFVLMIRKLFLWIFSLTFLTKTQFKIRISVSSYCTIFQTDKLDIHKCMHLLQLDQDLLYIYNCQSFYCCKNEC